MDNDDLSEELRFLNIKLDDMSDKFDDTSEKVSKIKDALYHPDNGIYARIRSNEEVTREITKWTHNHEESDLELRKNCNYLATAIEPLAYDYRLRMSRKKWTDKIVSVIITITVASVLGLGWKIINMATQIEKVNNNIHRSSSPVNLDE